MHDIIKEIDNLQDLIKWGDITRNDLQGKLAVIRREVELELDALSSQIKDLEIELTKCENQLP